MTIVDAAVGVSRLLECVSGNEEQEERCQSAVDEKKLLVPGHRVSAQTVILVLGEAGHHLDARLKLVLRGTAHGANVLRRDFLRTSGNGSPGDGYIICKGCADRR